MLNEWKHTKPSFSPLVLWISVSTSFVFVYTSFITNLQELGNSRERTNMAPTRIPLLSLPRVYVCRVVVGEEGHWPGSHRSGACCGGTKVDLLEGNGRMSDRALGSPQSVEHYSLRSLSGWQLPASERCQAGCDSCAVRKCPRFSGALTFLTCCLLLVGSSWDVLILRDPIFRGLSFFRRKPNYLIFSEGSNWKVASSFSSHREPTDSVQEGELLRSVSDHGFHCDPTCLWASYHRNWPLPWTTTSRNHLFE